MKAAIRSAGKDEFSSLGDQMGRWLDNVLGPDYHRYRPGDNWEPGINLYEDSASFYVVVDLAGVDAESLDLRIERGELTLRGERQSPRPHRGEGEGAPIRVHLMEIDHGPFLRTLELPDSVDPGSIEATYRNGFVWVRMSKKA